MFISLAARVKKHLWYLHTILCLNQRTEFKGRVEWCRWHLPQSVLYHFFPTFDLGSVGWGYPHMVSNFWLFLKGTWGVCHSFNNIYKLTITLDLPTFGSKPAIQRRNSIHFYWLFEDSTRFAGIAFSWKCRMQFGTCENAGQWRSVVYTGTGTIMS